MFAASSAAQAQCTFVGGVRGAPIPGFEAAGSLPASIATSVATVSTAFLTQTTAFVASPPASQPNQFAGGVWIRGVGGRADVDNAATGAFSAAPAAAGTFSCTSSTRSTYGGVQGGFDIGRLDIGGGWNAHIGVTAGYLNMNNKSGTATADFDVPFIGLYGVITNGGFYIDAQVRKDFYDMTVSDPSIGVAGQHLGADGWGVTASTGYVFNIGNIIVEPSAGVVYSTVRIDPLGFAAPATPPFGAPLTGTLNIQDIESLLGRAGVRLATNLTAGNVVFQPFVAASVWHEFADNLSGTLLCAAPCGGLGVTLTGNASGNRIGTFGQYSVGVAASLPETPWVGYVRFDYRNGDRFDSINFNGGIRYQFAPEAAPAVVRARS